MTCDFLVAVASGESGFRRTAAATAAAVAAVTAAAAAATAAAAVAQCDILGRDNKSLRAGERIGTLPLRGIQGVGVVFPGMSLLTPLDDMGIADAQNGAAGHIAALSSTTCIPGTGSGLEHERDASMSLTSVKEFLANVVFAFVSCVTYD